MSTGRAALGLLALLATLVSSARAEVVSLADDGAPVVAHWLPAADETTPRPAVAALHGCGGLYRRDGRTFDPRYTEYVERLHRAGFHVLLPDSFGPRGVRSICTLRNAERSITTGTRRADVAAAVHWLARQPGVDARRIVLLGWSHGASTALVALNRAHSGGVPVAAAVVFYPGCSALLKSSFALDAPLLMQLGAKDDWTPPGPCVELADRTRRQRPETDLTVRVYPESYHGFDSVRPVRLRRDVPNGVDPAGVHQGGNPQARAEAQAAMDAFLARVLK